jgi:hypothetical protein
MRSLNRYEERTCMIRTLWANPRDYAISQILNKVWQDELLAGRELNGKIGAVAWGLDCLGNKGEIQLLLAG